MKILPRKEFEDLQKEQEFIDPEFSIGFIDKITQETVVLEGASTRVKTHESGHQAFEHMEKSVKFWSPRTKDPRKAKEPWTQAIDDEIEAEVYSYSSMDKRLTPRVGLMALRMLINRGWNIYPALSIVIGRMKRFGIRTSLRQRRDLVSILERTYGVIPEYGSNWQI